MCFEFKYCEIFERCKNINIRTVWFESIKFVNNDNEKYWNKFFCDVYSLK